MPEPLTQDERARILELQAEGMPRNRIAAEVGRSSAAVSKVVHAAGRTFDRPPGVVAAVAAKRVDNAERRANAVARLYDIVDRLLDRLQGETHTVVGFDFGKAVRTQVSWEEVPPADIRSLTATVANLLHSAAKLEALDTGSNADHARSVIVTLGEQIRALVGDYPGDGPEAHDDATEAGE